MANVYLTATTALATSFNVVTAAATTINTVVNTIADMAQVASLHSSAYLEATRKDIADNAELRALVGRDEAKLAIAERQLAIQARINANPALMAKFTEVGEELKTLRSVKVAA